MGEFTNSKTVDGFSVKLWRGERMALIGMDVEEPEDNLVGFSIEVQSPQFGVRPAAQPAGVFIRQTRDRGGDRISELRFD